jgi:hypothetical protein
MEHGWKKGRDMLTSRDVLVIDEAGMVGTRQLERVLSHAAEAGAKVVLVGDPQQLQSIEAGAAFRSIHERHGGVEIGEVRRQREDWQRDATRDLATGRTGDAISAYDVTAWCICRNPRAGARRSDRPLGPRPAGIARQQPHHPHPHQCRGAANSTRPPATGCGRPAIWARTCASRSSAANATSPPGIASCSCKTSAALASRTARSAPSSRSAQIHDRATDDGRSISFDLKDYDRIDHGYAATIHKAQGMTVDRTHVLATPGMDAHGSYVALSRHRDGMDLHYGRDDFADQDKLINTLSRDRAKDMFGGHVRELPSPIPQAGRRAADPRP